MSNPSTCQSHYFQILIRVSKHDSALAYFLLESYENLCFYSTLPSTIAPGIGHRDILLKGSGPFYEATKMALGAMAKTIEVITLSDEKDLVLL